MSADFKGTQLRTNQIIASRSSGEGVRPSLIIMSASSPGVLTPGDGTYTSSTLLAGVGSDVWMFVSGAAHDKGVKGVVLMGGDLVVSGTLYAEKQVIEVDETVTGSLSVSGSLYVKDVIHGHRAYLENDLDVSGSSYVAGNMWLTGQIIGDGSAAFGYDGTDGRYIRIGGGSPHMQVEQTAGSYRFQVAGTGYATRPIQLGRDDGNNIVTVPGTLSVGFFRDGASWGPVSPNPNSAISWLTQSAGFSVSAMDGESGLITKELNTATLNRYDQMYWFDSRDNLWPMPHPSSSLKIGGLTVDNDVGVSGSLSMATSQNIYFDGSSNTQFINGNGFTLTIDGDNYVRVYADSTFEVYGSTALNEGASSAYDFQVKGVNKQGFILADAGTTQVGLLTDGESAADAYGLNASTEPIPGYIGLWISGAVGSANSTNVGSSLAGGAVLMGGDLVVSGAMHLQNVVEPTVQAAGESVLYTNSGLLYFKNAGGAATAVGSGGGGADNIGWTAPAADQIATTGSLSLAIDQNLYFNGQGGDQFISGDDDHLTIDGDNYVSLVADVRVNVYGNVLMNAGHTTSYDFRASGGTGKAGIIFSDSGTKQVGILTDGGNSALDAYGLNASSEPIPGYVGLWISGAIGSYDNTNAASSVSAGAVLMGGDLVVSGVLHVQERIRIDNHAVAHVKDGSSHIDLGSQASGMTLGLNAGNSSHAPSNTDPAIYIDATGSVGIGAADAPGSVLHIRSEHSPWLIIDPGDNVTANPQLWLQDTNASSAGFKVWYDNDVGRTYFDNYYDNNAADMHFRVKVADSAQTVLTVAAELRVGINDDTPSYSLDVNGDCRITESLLVNTDLGAFDFRVGSDTKQGAVLLDGGTQQLGLLTDGTTAADAYGLNASTYPIPNDVGLFISGAIGSVGTTSATESERYGAVLIGGDLVVSGTIYEQTPATLSFYVSAASTASAAKFNIFDFDNYSGEPFPKVDMISAKNVGWDEEAGEFQLYQARPHMVTMTLILADSDGSGSPDVTISVDADTTEIYTTSVIVHSSVDPTERTVSFLIAGPTVAQMNAGTPKVLEFWVDSASADTVAVQPGTTLSIYAI